MSESAEHTAAGPRFPWLAAVLCAACVGAAVWTWMRYSYAWEVTPKEVLAFVERHETVGYVRSRYVRLHGLPLGGGDHQGFGAHWVVDPDDVSAMVVLYTRPGTVNTGRDAIRETGLAEPGIGVFEFDTRGTIEAATAITISGRASSEPFGRVEMTLLLEQGKRTFRFQAPCVDATASRFHPASIAGLVVGAMGVFVFTAALRHWLRERRERRRNGIVT